MKNIKKELFRLKNEKYKEFNLKLIPNILAENSIGIKIPDLRRFVKTLSKMQKEKFLKDLPHQYLEENNMHILIINEIKNYDTAIKYLENFLDYIDNWQTSDLISPKIFKRYPKLLYPKIISWIKSKKEYKIRVAIKLLISFYLDENYNKKILEVVSNINLEKYYVKMAIAWFFSFALVKHFNDSLFYLKNNKLDKFSHNTTIQKCMDSKRMSKEKKDILRKLKIK